MRSDARNAQARPLLHRHFFRQRSNLVDGNHSKLSGRSERAIGLHSVTPYRTAHPFGGNACAQLVHLASAVAMRNHARVRHTVTKGILSLLNIPRIYPGGGNANSNFTRPWNRVWHFA